MAEKKYYDFGVHAAPEGKNTGEELALLAKHLGYSGFALVTRPENSTVTLPEQAGFEVFRGIELVEENPSKLHGLIGKFRPAVDILVVHGGSEKINRAAVESQSVDILAYTSLEKGSGMNQVLAKAARDNEVAIGLSLRPLLNSRGFRRVRLLSDFRANLDLARKYEVSLILSSDAVSCFDLRAPGEMLALAELLGMDEAEAFAALSTAPEEIIKRNRPAAGYVRKGVEILEEGDWV